MLSVELFDKLKSCDDVLFEYRYILKHDGKLSCSYVVGTWKQHEDFRYDVATRDDVKVDSAVRELISVKLLDECLCVETVKAPCDPESEKHIDIKED